MIDATPVCAGPEHVVAQLGIRELGDEIKRLGQGRLSLGPSFPKGSGGARGINREAQYCDAFAICSGADCHRRVVRDQERAGPPKDALLPFED